MRRYKNMTDAEYNSWRDKLSKAKKGKPSWNKGKHLSEKHREHLRYSHLGYKHTDEQKEKVRIKMTEYMNRPEIKKKYSKISKKRFEEGTHNFIEIIKIRQFNARITTYDLTKSAWKTLRNNIKERDNWKCQQCFIDLHNKKSNCHHRIPYRMSKNNSKENLLTLCLRCHSAIEYWTKKFFRENPKIPKTLNSLNMLKKYISEHMRGTIQEGWQ